MSDLTTLLNGPADRKESEEELNQRRNRFWRELLGQAGERYSRCGISNYRIERPAQKQVVDAIKEYIADVKGRRDRAEGVVLYGPVGTGKDHLAFAIAHAAVGAFMRVQWLNGQEWFGQLRDSIDSKEPEEVIIRTLVAPDFLVISDPLPPIGALTQHQATMLYWLIEARDSSRKPTIVTINVATDSEADSRLGAATWDRLCGSAWKIKCAWPSYRKPTRVIG